MKPTIANETQQNEKQKEIMELENTIAQQASVFQQALNTFKSAIDGWKKKIFVGSPCKRQNKLCRISTGKPATEGWSNRMFH